VIRALAVVLVVLAARALAYAAAPDPSARFLQHEAGGPAVPALALVALGICAMFAVSVCWLVAVGVRERALIERREASPFAVARTLWLAAALTFTTCFVGGMFEGYLHWRAGLGWHGLHCLVGPVHRDLIPFEAGLSCVAAALIAGARHLTAWMRRTFARLGAELPAVLFVASPAYGAATAVRAVAPGRVASARAPPLPG
jgi:hypothetical protein